MEDEFGDDKVEKESKPNDAEVKETAIPKVEEVVSKVKSVPIPSKVVDEKKEIITTTGQSTISNEKNLEHEHPLAVNDELPKQQGQPDEVD
jgi:hypothetical protein